MYRGGNGVDGSVEGVVGGCGTLVQNDTFYGDTRVRSQAGCSVTYHLNNFFKAECFGLMFDVE